MAKSRVKKKVELNFDALNLIDNKYQAFAGEIRWTWRYIQPNPLEAPQSPLFANWYIKLNRRKTPNKLLARWLYGKSTAFAVIWLYH